MTETAPLYFLTLKQVGCDSWESSWAVWAVRSRGCGKGVKSAESPHTHEWGYSHRRLQSTGSWLGKNPSLEQTGWSQVQKPGTQSPLSDSAGSLAASKKLHSGYATLMHTEPSASVLCLMMKSQQIAKGHQMFVESSNMAGGGGGGERKHNRAKSRTKR